ncbi:MAG: toll/interleukin-1 receptor domain-containing protein [Cyanobacteria bacterium P01_E01_bin.34]
MAFEQDVFISYAHIDNEPLLEDSKGWVTRFHKILEKRLAQFMGVKPKIWRDEKLQGNDKFGPEIVEQLPKAALLVSVLTPRYVKSEWCLRELHHFYQEAAKTGGLLKGNKSRVFIALKTPIPREERPEDLQDFRGYEFYELDADRFVEYSHELGRDMEVKFVLKVTDLARDMEKLLKVLAAESLAEEPALVSPSGKVVYLAETSSELTSIRDAIRRDLELAGHVVLPDRPLPNTAQFTTEVEQLLAQSDLSVHLLAGGNSAPESEDWFAAQLSQFEMARMQEQLNAALEWSQKTPGFAQIAWVPGDRERQFWSQEVEDLPRHLDAMQTTVEELKTVIQMRIDNPPPVVSTKGSVGELPTLYLDFHKRDFENPEPDFEELYDYLAEHFTLLVPNYDAGSGDGVMSSEQKLQQADGVLIFYGQGSRVWFDSRINALTKSLSFTQADLPRAVYLGNPSKGAKDNWQPSEWLTVIRQGESFSEELLAGFVARFGVEAGG